ncbi:hypothetical protein CC85DRAFT_178378 [Cutaneotrichosporon oleaginosum]|uniref:Uncharacterized protein n=1 Tax=Cutaneotrichosporon oleaginosum TaxID=879819 RepID=A0A0J0XFG0_9TREE|nr:uncharacterized protein CC85DRAFT_178378 [Cutaneotrichosporon oleaginosum]KLT39783.1 hypothetical protein CC85DRAFT_178378 [Cutaneotrichosporon oleaginosum]TXT05671.1 hypothetical protein COLE_06991 [Cutaneotrichosporon oleaginosum]
MDISQSRTQPNVPEAAACRHRLRQEGPVPGLRLGLCRVHALALCSAFAAASALGAADFFLAKFLLIRRAHRPGAQRKPTLTTLRPAWLPFPVRARFHAADGVTEMDMPGVCCAMSQLLILVACGGERHHSTFFPCTPSWRCRNTWCGETNPGHGWHTSPRHRSQVSKDHEDTRAERARRVARKGSRSRTYCIA